MTLSLQISKIALFRNKTIEILVSGSYIPQFKFGIGLLVKRIIYQMSWDRNIHGIYINSMMINILPVSQNWWYKHEYLKTVQGEREACMAIS